MSWNSSIVTYGHINCYKTLSQRYKHDETELRILKEKLFTAEANDRREAIYMFMAWENALLSTLHVKRIQQGNNAKFGMDHKQTTNLSLT